MRKILLTLITMSLIACSLAAQTTKLWTENDRQYLLDNLTRSYNKVIKETHNLTPQQWSFKESPDRWSINQVVEHINIYELLFQREITLAIASKLKPELAVNTKPDSLYVGFIMEEKQHITEDYTKPFTYSVPLGLYEGKNNIAMFTKLRNESIDFIKNTKEDLRLYSSKEGRPNLHQLYIYVFGHVDRQDIYHIS